MSAEVPSTGEAATGPFDLVRLVGIGGIGHHGVLASERQDGQTFLADLTLSVDTRVAARTDDLKETVNYAELAANVVAVIEGEPVNLIETLATRVAKAALAFAPVREVTVVLHKPDAPVGVPFSDVQVEIHRREGDDLTTTSAAGEGVESIEPSTAAPADDGATSAAAAMPPVVAPAAVVPASAPPAPPVITSSPAEPSQPAADASDADLNARPDQPTPTIIAMGGNIGDVRATLKSVVSDLNAIEGVTVVEVSPLARTAPVLAEGADPQPDFLNAVVQATTTLAPKELLDSLHEIENAYGRKRTIRWGERTLDLDIIVYGNLTSDDPELTLPHPRAKERAFVLVPWAHMDPDAFLAGLGGGPVADLAETAPDRTGVRWLALDWMNSAPATTGPQAKPAASPTANPAAPAAAAEESAGEGKPDEEELSAEEASAEEPSAEEPADEASPAEELPAEVPVAAEPADEASPADEVPAESPVAAEPAAADTTHAPQAAASGEEPAAPAGASDPQERFTPGPDTAEQEGTQDEELSDLELLAPEDAESTSAASAASPQSADLPWTAASAPDTPSPIVPKWQPLRRNNP